jgi:hypothetical protein
MLTLQGWCAFRGCLAVFPFKELDRNIDRRRKKQAFAWFRVLDPHHVFQEGGLLANLNSTRGLEDTPPERAGIRAQKSQ